MRKVYLIPIIVLALSPILISLFLINTQEKSASSSSIEEKVYVALEAEGRVGVIDAQNRKVIDSIDLSEVQNNTFVKYTAHNVQVSPDGKKVLVTANVDRGVMGEKESEETEDITDGLVDKIFIIDPISDLVTGAIPIDVDTHLAHIVVNSSGNIAYVTLQEKGQLYAVDLYTNKVVSTFEFGEESEPHGLRLLPDNSKVFVALIGKKAMASVDTKTGEIRYYPFSGAAMQTAVTPDGEYVFASVYDTKKVAWVHLPSNTQGYIDLPVEDAKGSVQLYATPDSKYLYVVNQGYYFDQPTGETVYRIDINKKSVDQTIVAGSAPHGVVVDKAGAFVYVTNLLSKDVSVIDTSTNKEVARIPVGEMPNGISIWHKKLGGTP